MRPNPEQIRELCLSVVFPYAMRRLRRREEAEDACSEVFLAAATALRTPKTEGEWKYWLLGIARNKVANAMKNIAKHSSSDYIEDQQASEIASDDHLLLEQVRKEIWTLPEKQREAILLIAAEGHSVKEAAKVMRKSEISVQSLVSRARRTLIERLGNKEVSS